jgi:hypothetical protein
MPSQAAQVMVPPPVATPRGAAWASRLFEMLLHLGNRTWQVMEAVGQARARRELLSLAERHADQPDFARQLREAAHRAVMSRD